MFFLCFLLGRNFNNPGAERKCRLSKVFQEGQNGIDGFGHELEFMSEKPFSGDSATRIAMLLVGKVRCSSPFFVAGGGWKGGQKSVVDVVCVLGWYSLKPSSA